MENWQKGDVAICVNTTGSFSNGPGALPALRLHSEYIVNDVFVCRCGCVSLDVGLAAPVKSTGTWCNCRTSLPYPDVHWCHSARFIKKKTKEDLRVAIEKAIDNEDYELVIELKSQLKE
jgi:hypothetical protein